MIGGWSALASWLVMLCLAWPGAAVAAEPEPEDDYLHFAGGEAGERRLIQVAPGLVVAFRWCPPGEFTMGSSEQEKAVVRAAGLQEKYTEREVERRVTLTRGFWLAETPVTQGQWQAVMGTSLWEQARKAEEFPLERSGSKPMYYVNHAEAEEWCSRAGRHAGVGGWRMVLPTEAQWEYACRAGTRGMTFAGDFEIPGRNDAPGLDAIAWYGGNSSVGYPGNRGEDTSLWEEKQYPGGWAGPRWVGRKQANPWGLHDMIGNVWEWCADWAGEYGPEAVRDPAGPEEGARRVNRGGAWDTRAAACRAALRHGNPPGIRNDVLGFRPALVPSGQGER